MNFDFEISPYHLNEFTSSFRVFLQDALIFIVFCTEFLLADSVYLPCSDSTV